MVLVDTSVLIDYLKGVENLHVSTFDQILDLGLPYGINCYIYQELLQGSRTAEEFRKLKDYLETIPFYSLNFGKESYEKAAHLNVLCRNAGITIPSTIDLLIAQTAIEHSLFLLHNDKDFQNMSLVIPELKIYEVKES